MWSLFIIYMIGLLLSFVPYKFTYKLNLILASVAIFFSTFDILKRIAKEPIYIEKYDIESVYSPSEVFCKTTYSDYLHETNNPQRVLRSIMFNTSIKNENKGIVIHEIDTDDCFNIRHCQEWQQPTSWHHNQLLGSQYILEAIRNDGGLYSNKGVCFSDTGFVRLTYPYSLYKSQPLILDLNGVTHLHDSDYTSSYLANYQSSLNNEIVQNGYRHILLRILSILFLLAIILQLIHFPLKKNNIQIVNYVLMLFVFLIIYIFPHKGDLRIVGKITNSHENFKYDGVAKNIVANGFNYTTGELGAKILVVSSNSFAIWLGEQVVILEPNAKLLYKTKILSSNNLPIGNNKNIPDARQINYNGKLYSANLSIDSINIIATGSPAKLEWKKLLE